MKKQYREYGYNEYYPLDTAFLDAAILYYKKDFSGNVTIELLKHGFTFDENPDWIPPRMGVYGKIACLRFPTGQTSWYVKKESMPCPQ